MKDNNLGLGAKQGRSREEGLTTGLDMFQDVLGRLNGKSEAQLATEQKSRTQLRGSNFVQQRWGILDFVSGGFLVGDESQVPSKVSTSDEFSSERATNAQDCAKSQPRAKDEKVCSNTMKRTKHKKSRRDFVLQDHESDEALDVQQPSNQDQTWTGGRVGFRQDKARRKAEKAARQLRREAKRDKRDAMLSKDRAAYNLSTPRTIGDLSRSNVERREGPQTASVQATILPVIGGNRQAVRQRYIQQKKLSMMDSKALNEVRLRPGIQAYETTKIIHRY